MADVADLRAQYARQLAGGQSDASPHPAGDPLAIVLPMMAMIRELSAIRESMQRTPRRVAS